MNTNQIYDKDGTTSFQFTYIERSILKKRKSEWHVLFSQGFISINEQFKQTQIKVNFPVWDHWTYEKHESTLRDGAFCRGAEIKNRHFTLTVDVCEYLDPDDPEFNPDRHEEGSHEGHLVLDTNTSSVSISIPYKLALNLINFMAGSTELSGVSKSSTVKALQGRVEAAQREYDNSVTDYEQRLKLAKSGECSWREADAALVEQGRTADVYVNLEKELLAATITEAAAVIASAAASTV